MHDRGSLCVPAFLNIDPIPLVPTGFAFTMELRGESRDRLRSADLYVMYPSMLNATLA
jgi:hypothetical protein